MSVPESQYSVVAEIFLSHRHLLGTGDDDKTREWTRILVNAIRQRTRDPRWGRKRTTPTHPAIGKDGVAYRRDGIGPYIFDVLVGSGTNDPKPGWQRVPEAESNTQFWTDEGLDHVPDSGTNVPNPGTKPCEQKFAAMVEQIGALTELANDLIKDADLLAGAIRESNLRLDAIEKRLAEMREIPSVVELSRSWGHSHKATLK